MLYYTNHTFIGKPYKNYKIVDIDQKGMLKIYNFQHNLPTQAL